jgi:hypothetical protein
MSVYNTYINFPMIPVASSSQIVGGVCNALIDFVLPTGITIDHFRLKMDDNSIYNNLRCYRIKGEFRQFDANGNLLQKNSFDLVYANSVVFSKATDVYFVEIYISYYEIQYVANFNLNPDQVLNGTGYIIFYLRIEDASNNVTCILNIRSNKVITTAKNRETITVTGRPPVRVFNITTTNTGSYIKEWWAEIKSITGTPQSSDTLVLELLDASDNVLASNNVGIGVGNRIAVQHNPNAVKVRVRLQTNVLGLSVVVDVSEGIDITYGT